MVKVTKLPPPPDVYTTRVQVEMSEAEWIFIERCMAQYAIAGISAPVIADAASRVSPNPRNYVGFYSLDYSRLFRDSNSPPKYPELNEREKDLAHYSPISAIKEIRTRLSLGLKEAKDAVDHYRSTLK